MPINHTASKPREAMASHSIEGTELRLTEAPVFVPSSASQTHVLISYTRGFRTQVGMTPSTF